MNLGDPFASLVVKQSRYKQVRVGENVLNGQMEVGAIRSTWSLGKPSTWGRDSGNKD